MNKETKLLPIHVSNSSKREWWQTRYVQPDGIAGYLATYQDILTPQVSRFEVESSLAMPGIFGADILPDDAILDGFCGTGRHASEALTLGFNNWTMFDYSEEMLLRAAQALTAHHEKFTISQQDARALNFLPGSFKLYQVLGNSALGFFDNPSDDLKVLQAAHQVLQPGGFFVFDLTDHTYAMKQLTNHTKVNHEKDGTVVRQRSTEQQNGLLRTGHIEYRFGRYININPHEHDVQVLHHTDDTIALHTQNSGVLTTDVPSVDIQSVGRWVYTSNQIMDLMREAGFEPAVSLQRFNYDHTTDRFGTMGVRNLYIGKKL